jgi:CxxC motif-containing protein (DUF1111 family)
MPPSFFGSPIALLALAIPPNIPQNLSIPQFESRNTHFIISTLATRYRKYRSMFQINSHFKRMIIASGLALAVFVSVVSNSVMTAEVDHTLSTADFTTKRADKTAYSEPAPVLSHKQQQVFMMGRLHFNIRWVTVNSLEGDWGLGPTFVADRCSACHVGGGRGSPPHSPDQQLLSMLVRLSVPGEGEHGEPMPHPNYGDQIQNRALQGQDINFIFAGTDPVPTEAALYLDWTEKVVAFGDGEEVRLRVPKLRIEQLNFGPLGHDTMTSLRLAPPVFGLGLLATVPETTILKVAAEQKERGFNGRPNYVWDVVANKTTLGRFGWKANQPSIKQQIAVAAIGDMGVNSHLYYEQNCPPIQTICRAQMPANDPELINADLNELEFWTLGLAVPARRDVDDPEVKRGEKLFEEAQCGACHLPTLKTATEFPSLPQLANQLFHAYTDLLLHDMGDELADGRPDFKAGSRDWRTPPLWELGLSKTVSGSTAMLHDGRARDASEAILWHGGEAKASRDAFMAMKIEDRGALLKFLNSL